MNQKTTGPFGRIFDCLPGDPVEIEPSVFIKEFEVQGIVCVAKISLQQHRQEVFQISKKEEMHKTHMFKAEHKKVGQTSTVMKAFIPSGYYQSRSRLSEAISIWQEVNKYAGDGTRIPALSMEGGMGYTGY